MRKAAWWSMVSEDWLLILYNGELLVGDSRE